MRGALKAAAYEGSLLVRLEGASEPFWQAVSDALLAIAEAMHAAAASH